MTNSIRWNLRCSCESFWRSCRRTARWQVYPLWKPTVRNTVGLYQELGLFGPEQCEPNSYSSLDYEGKVLVLSPDTLKESYWTPQAQLWYAHDGFGCSPHAIGRSVRCTCLGDGEMTSWNRTDFIGVLREEFLPDWAEEKLEELRGQDSPDFSPQFTMK